MMQRDAAGSLRASAHHGQAPLRPCHL